MKKFIFLLILISLMFNSSFIFSQVIDNTKQQTDDKINDQQQKNLDMQKEDADSKNNSYWLNRKSSPQNLDELEKEVRQNNGYQDITVPFKIIYFLTNNKNIVSETLYDFNKDYTVEEYMQLAGSADNYYQRAGYISKAIDKHPEYAHLEELYLIRAVINDVYIKDYEKAIDDYTKALSVKPDNNVPLPVFCSGIYPDYKTYGYRGNIFKNIKQYDKAILDFKKEIELKPDYAVSYNDLGNCYDDLKDYTQAIFYFSKAIDIDKDFSVAYLNRGTVYYKIMKFTEALNDFKKSIVLNPELEKNFNDLITQTKAFINSSNYTDFFWKGKYYFDWEKYNDAILEFNKALELNPKDTSSFFFRGKSYASIKNYKSALEDYNNVILLNPKDALTYTCIGDMYKNDFKNNEEAIKEYEKANNINDYTKWYSSLKLSILYFQTNDAKNAKSFFKKSLKSEPRLENGRFGIIDVEKDGWAFTNDEKLTFQKIFEKYH